MPEPEDHFDKMLKNYKALLPQMRDKFGQSNCPLTAEAVWKYFSTATVHVARRAVGGQTPVCSPVVKKITTLKELKKLLLAKGHGAHGVLTVNAGEKTEHNLNVVNIRGKVYMVDAYNPQGVLTDQLEAWLSYGKKFEFSWRWDVHIVPADQIINFRCPAPPPPANTKSAATPNKAAPGKR